MLLLNHDFIVGPWVCRQLGCVFVKKISKCIGVERNGVIIAAVLFERYNSANIYMHVAATEKNWLTKELLKTSFVYPFETLKTKRITLTIESKNKKSIRLAEHIGFTKESVMFGAAKNDDIIVYRMFKNECRWI